MPHYFTSQLRYRLSLLRDRREYGSPLSYRSFQNYSPSLSELTAADSYKEGVQLDENGQKYSALLLKKIILITFQLFCLSEELHQDVSYSYGECQKICLAVHEFNQRHCKDQNEYSYQTSSQHLRPCSYYRKKTACLNTSILHRDLIEVYITARAECITAALHSDCSVQNVLQLARFERGFLVALTGLVATFTSILSTSIKCRIGGKKESMFGPNELPSLQSTYPTVISWMDCLIPGAQSDVLKPIWKTTQCKLWSNVAQILIAQAQPMFEGGRILIQFLPQLVESTEHTGLNFCFILHVYITLHSSLHRLHLQI